MTPMQGYVLSALTGTVGAVLLVRWIQLGRSRDRT
jgi:hypothetical protein